MMEEGRYFTFRELKAVLIPLIDGTSCSANWAKKSKRLKATCKVKVTIQDATVLSSIWLHLPDKSQCSFK